jgi:ATP-dependent Clp protease ATP-binding subunit ClpA
LQIMDNGTLTDSNGRETDFRHLILIMTSNAGATQMARSSVGFIEQDNTSEGNVVVSHMFPPEFRNRLDAIVPFHSLTPETILHVVDKFLVELQAVLDEKHVHLEVDASARMWLAERGYEPAMGARPMGRLIAEALKKPLANELLFGQLVHGGEVYISVNDARELEFEYKANKSNKRSQSSEEDQMSL